MKRERYLWVPRCRPLWLVVCTLTAGWQKLFHADAKIGFLAHARAFADALARGEVLAPAKSLEEMQRVIFNNQLDAALCALFMGVVVTLVFAVRAALRARRSGRRPRRRRRMWRSMRFAERVRDAWRRVATARLAFGVPDYDAYVAHVRARHPDTAPMTREAFCVERMHARYGAGRRAAAARPSSGWPFRRRS